MNALAPLAERLRPRSLHDYFGQEEVLGEQAWLRNLIFAFQKDPRFSFPSLILWGPPGCGKTTLARLLATELGVRFEPFSAVSSGVKELRVLLEIAETNTTRNNTRTLLFVDEIHRFNKAQQDVLLPAVEQGFVFLVGATTENPSFEINSALLSRSKTLLLTPLSLDALDKILRRALSDASLGLGAKKLKIQSDARSFLLQHSSGDARSMLNTLEIATAQVPEGGTVDLKSIQDALGKKNLRYDKNGEEHFNLISAFQKSIRHSDPQASLYYLARMIEGGEDPMYLARRLLRIAAEDIGLADPQALVLANSAAAAVHMIGFPEGDVVLAELTIYLASAPKSNAAYVAMASARAEVKNSGALPVPLHYRNAPTALMKEFGYGKSYMYDHDAASGVSVQEALPDELRGKEFYKASNLGFEKEISKRMDYFLKLRNKDL